MVILIIDCYTNKTQILNSQKIIAIKYFEITAVQNFTSTLLVFCSKFCIQIIVYNSLHNNFIFLIVIRMIVNMCAIYRSLNTFYLMGQFLHGDLHEQCIFYIFVCLCVISFKRVGSNIFQLHIFHQFNGINILLL